MLAYVTLSLRWLVKKPLGRARGSMLTGSGALVFLLPLNSLCDWFLFVQVEGSLTEPQNHFYTDDVLFHKGKSIHF